VGKPRKTASTLEAVTLSIAASRGRPLRLLWAARTSPYVELTDSVRQYDITPLLGALPIHRRDGAQPWPEVLTMLRDRLGIAVESKRVSYLMPHRVEARESAQGALYDLSERMEGFREEAPAAWGFYPILGGQGRLPVWLHYLQNPRGPLERIRHLYCRTVVMRNRPGRSESPGTVWGWRDWHGVEKSPKAWLRGLGAEPEIWIRRRIARNSEVVSLSLFATRQTEGRTWEVLDLTAPLALHCAAVDLKTKWRRGVFLVERGDGLEWVLLMPSADGYEAGGDYEGSPARHLVQRLSEIWPKVKVRWILDDAPLTGEGDLR
jgi:hypothetical protein